MGKRTLRGGAKGYCKNDNRTSPGGFAEWLDARGREGWNAMRIMRGRKSGPKTEGAGLALLPPRPAGAGRGV